MKKFSLALALLAAGVTGAGAQVILMYGAMLADIRIREETPKNGLTLRELMVRSR